MKLSNLLRVRVAKQPSIKPRTTPGAKAAVQRRESPPACNANGIDVPASKKQPCEYHLKKIFETFFIGYKPWRHF